MFIVNALYLSAQALAEAMEDSVSSRELLFSIFALKQAPSLTLNADLEIDRDLSLSLQNTEM
jgi:hypothetical protein